MKTGTFSGHAVLNEIQWFILVAYKSDIPKNKVHELGDSRHTLSEYCGRYMRNTSENTQVYRLVVNDGRGKRLNRQRSHQIRQAKRMNFYSGAICISNPNPFVPLQTQMPLIAIHCGMRYKTVLFLMKTKW